MTNFEDHRNYLFAVAYRMVGTAMDAEDIVQEAWLRYQQATVVPDNTRAYLTKIVTNLSLDFLKSARVQREHYTGDWLPEPIVTHSRTPADEVVMAESISMAFLVLLEQLSPLERAVFILRHVFDYDYSTISQMLNRSESACRKIFSRAKQHLDKNQPRFNTTSEQHHRIVIQFIQSVRDGNINELTSLLANDAILRSDSGGKVSSATRPIYGSARIVAFIAGIAKKVNQSFTIRPLILNNRTGAIVQIDNVTITAIMFDIDNGTIQNIHMITNPDKLSQVQSSD